MWHHYQDISLLLNFFLQLKFEVRFLLGHLVYLFHQNVPPEAPYVLGVKIGSGGSRPQVWHQYQDISRLGLFLPRKSRLSISPKIATRGPNCTIR